MEERDPRTVVIELPVAMPSWNRLLAVNHFTRKKIRKLSHQIVKDAASGKDSDEWVIKAYLAEIRPSAKNKAAAAAAKRKRVRNAKK